MATSDPNHLPRGGLGLAAKADIRTRARAKAAELPGRMKSTVTGVREQAAARAGSMRGQLVGTTAAARQHRVPLAVAAAVLIAVWLAIWRWRKR